MVLGLDCSILGKTGKCWRKFYRHWMMRNRRGNVGVPLGKIFHLKRGVKHRKG